MSSPSFADLGVSQPVVAALAERGIAEPFAIQRLVVADVLAGRDVLAKSPTGSGKTLAFGVPMLDRIDHRITDRPAGLVLAPTRELALQIVEELKVVAKARRLWVAPVYGGVGYQKQVANARRAHVIVATPGRLEDLLDRGAFSLDSIDVLVLDEADRMLDMGFRPAVDRIVAQCPQDRQTLFFSATLDGEAGRVAARYTSDPARHEHVPEAADVRAIDHRFVRVERDQRIDALLETLGEDRDLALVFVRTKRGADRLAKRLGTHGISAGAMHGDKSQNQRERTLASFEAGRVDTLVATDVAARGIDVAGISHVINFDPPEDREGYVHRIGRTGRAGRTGIGVTFVGVPEAKTVEQIAGDLDLQREFGVTGLASPPRPARRPHDQGSAASGSARRRPGRRPSRAGSR
jgi:superfamily II DNA/RNA helicase